MSTFTAQTYTIDTILQMKQVYTESPYPGFNLFDICRKKSALGVQRLQKGEHAWIATKPKTSEEVLRKTVRGLLNKLTPEKYDEVFNETDLSQLLEEWAIEVVIELIFEKALLEPAYSKTYSRFCHDVAMYEVNLSPVAQTDGPKSRRSEFRNKIVSRAQREFERVSVVAEGLSKVAEEETNAATAKRKRANIKFVGQLYLQRVISQRTMHMIIRGIFYADDKKPSEIDVEVLTELLETIGKTIDESSEGRAAMDDHFEELRDLLKRINKKEIEMSPRIRFRIMDTVDLRENGWVPRINKKSNITPATFSEQQRALTTPTMGLGVRSPTTSSTPNRRSVARFPDTPGSNTSSMPRNPAWRGDVPASVSGSNPATPSSSAGMFPTRVSPQPHGAPVAPAFNVSKPSQKLAARIQAGRQEWKEIGPNQFDFANYSASLCGFDDVNEDNVKDVVAHEIIKEACTTSRADAQDEACKFLVAGVGVGKVPLLTTFGAVIQQAIEDDTAGDVPLFYARIVKIMKQCSGSTEAIDVYRDTIIATFYAFDQLNANTSASADTSPPSSPNQQGAPASGSGTPGGQNTPGFPPLDDDMTESYLEEILKVWTLLPKTDVDQAKVVSSVFESRGVDNSTIKLVVAVLDHLVTSQISTTEEIKKWTSSPKADGAAILKKALIEKFELSE